MGGGFVGMLLLLLLLLLMFVVAVNIDTLVRADEYDSPS